MRILRPLAVSILLAPGILAAENKNIVQESSLAIQSADRVPNLDRYNYVLHELNYSSCVVVQFQASRLARTGNLHTSVISFHLGDVDLTQVEIESSIGSDLVTFSLAERSYSELAIAYKAALNRIDELNKTYIEEAKSLGIKGFGPRRYAREKTAYVLTQDVLNGEYGVVWKRTHIRGEILAGNKTFAVSETPLEPQISTRAGYGEKLLQFLIEEKAELECS